MQVWVFQPRLKFPTEALATTTHGFWCEILLLLLLLFLRFTWLWVHVCCGKGTCMSTGGMDARKVCMILQKLKFPAVVSQLN